MNKIWNGIIWFKFQIEILWNVVGETIGPKATVEGKKIKMLDVSLGFGQSGMKITEMGESLENINPAKF